MSKNDQPFLVQRWFADGWTNGWTTAKPYEINSRCFWFLLKASGYANDGNNVHIMKVSRCGDPTKKFTHQWGEGWTTAEFYQAKNGNTFLFLMKAQGTGSDGFNVHIHEVSANGDIGDKVFWRDWRPGWTNAQFFAAGADRRFLFLYRSRGTGSDGHNVHVHEVLDNGDIGSQVFATDFPHNPQSFETVRSTVTYRVGQKSFLLVVRESGVDDDGNNVRIFELNLSGGFGSPVETRNLTGGWTSVRVFEARGRKYLFLLKKNEGRVNIRKINSDGKIGELVCAYDRKPSYTGAYGTGSLALEGGPIPWSTGWTTVEFLHTSTGETLLFAVKERLTPGQEKRAKICQVHAMSSVGPMVRVVSTTTASIWVGSVGHETPTATIRFRPTGWTAPIETPADFAFLAGKHYYNPGTATLRRLIANTEYTYEVNFNGKPLGGGRFRTAPENRPGVFTLAAASCIDLNALHYRTQKAWRHLLSKKPDFLILGGDNAYPNTTMRCMIWAEHLQTRGLDGFDEVIANTPTFATWDDHDFGPNNSAGADVEAANRIESLEAFNELFSTSFTEFTGIYHKFRWQDVDFFMLDVRFFRNHYDSGDSADRQMLGPDQWRLLETHLEESDAPFKVLVSGTTLDSGSTETWADDYPSEWKKLRELVARYRGVVVISGDVHRCKISSHPIAPDKLLWEFTSSGIGQNIGEPCHENDGFMTLTFDTTSDDPTILVRTFSKSGLESAAPRTIRQSMTT